MVITTLQKGDHISFKVGSEAWRTIEGTVCVVEYVSKGCQDAQCEHDDCWKEPYVSVRRCATYGVALKDVNLVWQNGAQYGLLFEMEQL